MGLVAFLITLLAVLAAVGHGGYLAMLSSAANKRPGGQPAVEFVKRRLPVAGTTLGVALLAMLISSGVSTSMDVVGILMGVGSGIGSIKGLQGSQQRFRDGQY